MYIATSFGTYRIGCGPVYRALSEVRVGTVVRYLKRAGTRGG